jgi:glycosyltransferase involved in cell wall biosynthesis
MTTLTAWYWQWVQYLDMRRIQRADVAVCVSHFQARAVRGAWGISDGKIHVLHNGINTMRFRPKTHPLRDRERRLLFVGGTNPRKGADLVLEAFAIVSKRHPDVSLDLVGGGNWAAHRRRARRLGIVSKVRFLPYVAHTEMPDYYSRAYALVAPTRSESFGRVLAEAMACGIPVISTQTGAVPEIVQHRVTGILVPPDDVDAFARAMLAVLEDPASAMWMGKNGRKLAVDRYAWSVIIHGWEELLRRLTARRDLVAEQGNLP